MNPVKTTSVGVHLCESLPRFEADARSGSGLCRDRCRRPACLENSAAAQMLFWPYSGEVILLLGKDVVVVLIAMIQAIKFSDSGVGLLVILPELLGGTCLPCSVRLENRPTRPCLLRGASCTVFCVAIANSLIPHLGLVTS